MCPPEGGGIKIHLARFILRKHESLQHVGTEREALPVPHRHTKAVYDEGEGFVLHIIMHLLQNSLDNRGMINRIYQLVSDADREIPARE